MIFRSATLAFAATALLAVAGCQGTNGSTPADSAGRTANTPSSGVGPGGHAPATNESHVGPTNAGPAGSQ